MACSNSHWFQNFCAILTKPLTANKPHCHLWHPRVLLSACGQQQPRSEVCNAGSWGKQAEAAYQLNTLTRRRLCCSFSPTWSFLSWRVRRSLVSSSASVIHFHVSFFQSVQALCEDMQVSCSFPNMGKFLLLLRQTSLLPFLWCTCLNYSGPF